MRCIIVVTTSYSIQDMHCTEQTLVNILNMKTTLCMNVWLYQMRQPENAKMVYNTLMYKTKNWTTQLYMLQRDNKLYYNKFSRFSLKFNLFSICSLSVMCPFWQRRYLQVNMWRFDNQWSIIPMMKYSRYNISSRLTLTCGRSFVSSSFPHELNWPSLYEWNMFEL